MGRNFTWAENGTDGRETISLIGKTPSTYNAIIAGGNEWVAISLGHKTEPMAGKRFHLFGKHSRRSMSIIWKW